jgi:hypothetical protein
MSPVFHHTFTWILTGDVHWTALAVMIIGDTVGILIVLCLAKGAVSLIDRHGPAAQFLRRWTWQNG